MRRLVRVDCMGHARIRVEQVGEGMYEKYCEGFEWGEEGEQTPRGLEEMCPKCGGACEVEEVDETLEGLELLKAICPSCGTEWRVEFSSWRGSIGWEQWFTLESNLAKKVERGSS